MQSPWIPAANTTAKTFPAAKISAKTHPIPHQNKGNSSDEDVHSLEHDRTDNRKRCCSCCCPFRLVCLDMLEDLVRDRIATISVAMFLLTMLVFSQIVFPPPVDQYVERLNFVAPPQYLLTIGLPSGRTPRVQVLMSDELLPKSCDVALKNTYARVINTPCPKVQARISNMVSTNFEQSLDCSFGHLRDVEDTLEGERLRDVCATSVINPFAYSDAQGVATFDNFGIHGPEGKYTLEFAADDAVLAFHVEMANPVVDLLLRTGPITSDNLLFKCGEVLPVQPTIQVSPLH